MSLKHAILGYLSIMPLSGYDLKKAFDTSVQHFWSAHQSQIYRTLYEMTAEGLVEQEVIPREQRLDVKIYHITKAGREELRHWLTTPLPPQDEREPFLIQVFFGSVVNDEETLANLRHERDHIEAQWAFYQELYRSNLERFKTRENKRQNFYTLLTLECGILQGIAYLEWLDDAIARVAAGDYTPKSLTELFPEED